MFLSNDPHHPELFDKEFFMIAFKKRMCSMINYHIRNEEQLRICNELNEINCDDCKTINLKHRIFKKYTNNYTFDFVHLALTFFVHELAAYWIRNPRHKDKIRELINFISKKINIDVKIYMMDRMPYIYLSFYSACLCPIFDGKTFMQNFNEHYYSHKTGGINFIVPKFYIENFRGLKDKEVSEHVILLLKTIKYLDSKKRTVSIKCTSMTFSNVIFKTLKESTMTQHEFMELYKEVDKQRNAARIFNMMVMISDDYYNVNPNIHHNYLNNKMKNVKSKCSIM